MPLKIAFVLKVFPTLSETFILNQITGLIDLGHHLDIYSRRTPSESKIHGDVERYSLADRTFYLDRVPNNRAVRVVKVLRSLVRNLYKSPKAVLSSLNLIKYGKESSSFYLFYWLVPFLGKHYDILHCHFGTTGNFGVLLKDLGVEGKLVTMFHGYDIRLGIQEGPQIYDSLFQKGDCFLANSQYTYDYLLSFGLHREKVISHPVGIDIDKFTRRNEQPRTDDNKTIAILTVARLVKEKGLEYGIRAIKKMFEWEPNLKVQYLIVGDGPLKAHLCNLASQLSLHQVVRFLGEMSQEEVIETMQKAHIFLLPSIEESFGVALLEAQAVELPVVATSVGGIPQAVKNGESGFLVTKGDENAIAQKLLHLIKNPQILPEAGKVGRKFIEEYYDIRKLNRRLVRIYEALLAT
jgi:colanic acid/amylovoran biosynthesis glycosyltransferase